VSVLFVPAVLGASADTTTTTTPATATIGDQSAEPARPKPSDRERRMRRELKALASAWADGGGTFGYPFWEKARQRLAMRQITTSMYREYVTGYRDRLVVGCDLLDQVDTETEVAGDVRRLVIDSCESRVEALRAEQRSLDLQIRRDGGDPDIDPASVEEEIADHDADALEAFQSSFRDARLAMDLAQTELDMAGLERLPEDAFV
jgi:hypothetical protein